MGDLVNGQQLAFALSCHPHDVLFAHQEVISFTVRLEGHGKLMGALLNVGHVALHKHDGIDPPLDGKRQRVGNHRCPTHNGPPCNPSFATVNHHLLHMVHHVIDMVKPFLFRAR